MLNSDPLLPALTLPAEEFAYAVRAPLTLQRAVGDAVAMAALRLRALALNDGTDWSRCDDHALVACLAARASAFLLPEERGVELPVYGFALIPAAAAAPASQRAGGGAAARPSVTASPPPAAAGGADPGLDQAAMAANLQQAAQDGVPFVEECEMPAAGAGA